MLRQKNFKMFRGFESPSLRWVLRHDLIADRFRRKEPRTSDPLINSQIHGFSKNSIEIF